MKSSPFKHIGKHPADQYTPKPGHMPHDHEGGQRVMDEMGNNMVTGENQSEIVGRNAADVNIAYDIVDKSATILENANYTLTNFGKTVQEVLDDPETTIRERKTKLWQYNNGVEAYDSLVKEYKFNVKNLNIAQEQYTNTVDSIYNVNLPLFDIAQQRDKLPPESYEEQNQLTLDQEAYIAMEPRERAAYVKKNYKY
jgi:hypothetical protein